MCHPRTRTYGKSTFLGPLCDRTPGVIGTPVHAELFSFSNSSAPLRLGGEFNSPSHHQSPVCIAGAMDPWDFHALHRSTIAAM